MNESPRSFAEVCWALGANTRLIALRSNNGMMKFGVVDNEVCKVSRCLGRTKTENSSPLDTAPPKQSCVSRACERILFLNKDTQSVSDPTTPRDKVDKAS